jgi:hypothetical protein
VSEPEPVLIPAHEPQEWVRKALEEAATAGTPEEQTVNVAAEMLERAAKNNPRLRTWLMSTSLRDGGVASGTQALKDGCVHAVVAYLNLVARGVIPAPAIARKR